MPGPTLGALAQPAMFSDAALRPYAQQAAQQAEATPPPPQSPASGTLDALARSAFWAGNAADAVTTAMAMKAGGHEGNPMLSWAGDKGAIPVGVGLNALLYWAGEKYLRDKHPKLLNTLWAATGAIHTGAALHNLGQRSNLIAAAHAPGPGPSTAPPFAGAVPCPDGSWINPDYASCNK